MKTQIEELVSGARDLLYPGDEVLDPAACVFLSGSFNPLHEGHLELLRTAVRMTGRTGALELSVTNVDKLPLDAGEVSRRIDRLEKHYPVVLTRAPTFLEKADLLPGGWFALGFDTAVRLLDSAYHDDIPGMLDRLAAQKNRFIIAGRLHDGDFQSLADLPVPHGYEHLFEAIPETRFRRDISSTELRGGA